MVEGDRRMIKIIFSDFDNTMLDYNGGNYFFDDYKISVLRRVKDKGIKFGIVSGRSMCFFKQFPNLLGSIDYIMSSNGACIYDVKNDEFIYQLAVLEDDFDRIIDYTINSGGAFLLNSKEQRFKYGEWKDTDCLEYDSECKIACDQIILSFRADKLQEVLIYLEQFKHIKINNISYFYGDCIIDINNKDVSKGAAASWLCNYLGINLDDAMAFGDGENDRSLFEAVNKGIAVANAIDKLKILSKDVTLSCDENGIYKYIEDNILE